MKRLILTVMVSSLVLLIACASAVTDGEEVASPGKITLDDALDILEVSFLLPSNFENIDAASEGLSNADLELGQDFSEVQVFFSEDDPSQLIYHVIGIIESRVEAASFDRTIEDDLAMEALIKEALEAGAIEAGITIEIPSVTVTHPNIGDVAIYGEGNIESYGLILGFRTLWFRINKVYYFGTSLNWSSDEVSLEVIAEEIEKRISKYSQ